MRTPTAPSDDPSARARLKSALAGLGCSPADVVALGVLVTGALAALGLVWLLARPAQPAGVQPPPGPPEGLALAEEELVVHVAGQVTAPGLYRLPAGARVADALEEAGGPLPEAAVDALNLARPLADGEQLLVPASPPADGAVPAASAASAGAPAWRPDGALDLNLATADDLQELPGIGPVLAERIVEHREQIGRFAAVGDLRDVAGIGEKTFQSIAELVTV